MKFSKLLVILAAALVAVALGVGPALAVEGKVFQGTCASFDEAKSVMVLKNDKNERDKNPVDKNLEEVTFDLKEATLGVRPSPGDKIRISFVEKDGKFSAHKVMNVTKQNIYKK
jgi:hypothetical protein